MEFVEFRQGDTLTAHLFLENPDESTGVYFAFVYARLSFGFGSRFELLGFDLAHPGRVRAPLSGNLASLDSLLIDTDACVPLTISTLICTWRLRAVSANPSDYLSPIAFDTVNGPTFTGLADGCAPEEVTYQDFQNVHCNWLRGAYQVPTTFIPFGVLKQTWSQLTAPKADNP